jgi:hypothetical protein
VTWTPSSHNRDGMGRRAMERCVLDSPAKHIDLLPTGE